MHFSSKKVREEKSNNTSLKPALNKEVRSCKTSYNTKCLVTLAIVFNSHHLSVDSEYKQYDLLNLIWISKPSIHPLNRPLDSE